MSADEKGAPNLKGKYRRYIDNSINTKVIEELNLPRAELQEFLKIERERADRLALELSELEKGSSKQAKVEFNRYKQDCRKRALEVAVNSSGHSDFENVKNVADKYYNWLISIPNE